MVDKGLRKNKVIAFRAKDLSERWRKMRQIVRGVEEENQRLESKKVKK